MTEYGSFKVTELKELVKERGIAATGLKLKQQFVDALQADDAAKTGGEDASGDAAAGTEHDPSAPEETSEVANGGAGQTQNGNAVDAAGGGDAANANAAASSDSEGTNKRKRRSPTPPPSEETITKKLKTEDNINVKLAEDLAKIAPVPVNDLVNKKTVQPYRVSDDVMQVDEATAESALDEARDTTNEPVGDSAGDGSRPASDTIMGDDGTTTAAKHSATRALYIRGLVRPLQPSTLREHIQAIATPPDAPSNADLVENFHLDKLRTHALVLFDSISSAFRARSALHDRIWPDESMRKPLWVDFVPEEKMEEWITTENARSDARWEVVYEVPSGDTDGPVVATLQEAGSGSSRQPSFSGGMRPSVRPPGDASRHRSSQTQEPPTPQRERPAQSKSFDTLDARYSFTETKPKIYFQPVAKDLADRRQDQFDEGTSRDWDDRQADPSLYGEGELRRYTFEDGDKLVDGGADFGLFGRRSTRGGRGGGPPRGGRGRGGGGGGGGGGDYYRGGGGRW